MERALKALRHVQHEKCDAGAAVSMCGRMSLRVRACVHQALRACRSNACCCCLFSHARTVMTVQASGPYAALPSSRLVHAPLPQAGAIGDVDPVQSVRVIPAPRRAQGSLVSGARSQEAQAASCLARGRAWSARLQAHMFFPSAASHLTNTMPLSRSTGTSSRKSIAMAAP